MKAKEEVFSSISVLLKNASKYYFYRNALFEEQIFYVDFWNVSRFIIAGSKQNDNTIAFVENDALFLEALKYI